jgi:hypothetical protein
VRICGDAQVAQTIVPRVAVAVTGVELVGDRRRGGASPRFALASAEGHPLLGGPLGRGRDGAGAPEAAGTVTLTPGTPYTLRLDGGRARCIRQRALVTDLALGLSLVGFETADLRTSRDRGATWQAAGAGNLAVTLVGPDAGGGGAPETCGDGRIDPREECDGRAADACGGACTSVCTCAPPPPACGDGAVAAGEACDGAQDGACPGRCTAACTCTEPPATCGDGAVAAGEGCDGAADAACPGRCTAACACLATPPPPARRFRSIYTSGYIGHYDAATVTEWPKRLGIILGEAQAQGPLVAGARAAAIAAGNSDARFAFYLSLTSLDAKCGCFDARFHDSFAGAHPEWFLRDASGAKLSTFVNEIGAQRQFAVDIGNPAYLDAWVDWAMAAMDRFGWDGVWIDNLLRGNFEGWSGWPIDPRTGARYTTADYRRDQLAALQHIRRRFDARGKMMIGNHSSAWEADTFADPVVRQQIVTMHALEIEDCVYTFAGGPHSESAWIAQLSYLDFANRQGVLTQCRGGNGTISDPGKRTYVLASYLLSKEGLSNVAQLNSVRSWWPGLEADLGAPRGGFGCLDPSAGLAPAARCPSPGMIYVREWEKGRVLVNPTAGRTITVPLGEPFLLDGARVTSVTLRPRSGVVLLRP